MSSDMVVRVAADLTAFKANMALMDNHIDTTASALKKMSTAFDPSKMIANANAAVITVKDIGGVAKLSDDQQKSLNTTLQAGLEAYQRLGREAPATLTEMKNKLDEIAPPAQHAQTATESFKDSVHALAVEYLSFEAARRVVEFAKRRMEEAEALQTLSAQTRLSVEDLQVLNGAMKEFGVDGEEIAKILFSLQAKIAGGDESVTAGLHAMGMSLEDVRGMNGMDLFLTIERGLAKLQGGLRDSTAADIFGERMGTAATRAAEGIDKTIAKWREHNTVLDKETNKALAEANTSVETLTNNWSTWWTMRVLGPLAKSSLEFGTLREKAGLFGALGLELIAPLSDTMQKYRTSLVQTGEAVPPVIDQHRELGKAAVDSGVQLTETQRIAQTMLLIERDGRQSLSQAQKENLDHLKEIGALTAKNAESIGVNAGQFKYYTDVVDKQTEAIRKLKSFTEDYHAILATIPPELAKEINGYLDAGASIDLLIAAYPKMEKQIRALSDARTDAIAVGKREQAAVKEWIAADAESMKIARKNWDDYAASVAARTGTLTDQKIAEIKRAADAEIAQYKASDAYRKTDEKEQTDVINSIVAKSQEKIRTVTTDWGAVTDIITKNSREGLQQAADFAKNTYEATLQAFGNVENAETQKLRLAWESAQRAADNWSAGTIGQIDRVGAESTKVAEQIALTWSRAMDLVRQGQGVMSGSVPANTDFSEEHRQQIQSAYDAHNYWGPVKNGAPDFEALGFGPPVQWRANGGPLGAGEYSVVGEKGPEVIRMGNIGGTVIPNNALGGGSPQYITIHVTQPLGTPSAIAAAVSSALMGQQLAQGQRVPVGL